MSSFPISNLGFVDSALISGVRGLFTQNPNIEKPINTESQKPTDKSAKTAQLVAKKNSQNVVAADSWSSLNSHLGFILQNNDLIKNAVNWLARYRNECVIKTRFNVSFELANMFKNIENKIGRSMSDAEKQYVMKTYSDHVLRTVLIDGKAADKKSADFAINDFLQKNSSGPHGPEQAIRMEEIKKTANKWGLYKENDQNLFAQRVISMENETGRIMSLKEIGELANEISIAQVEHRAGHFYSDRYGAA